MKPNPPILVTKLDAARRQLETAVGLYFRKADPISVHTLLSAAYQILSDINRREGKGLMLKDSVLRHVRPEARAGLKKQLKKAENFFKHADRDHANSLDFDPSETELFLFDACAKYRDLTGNWTPVLATFSSWFVVRPGAGLAPDSKAALVKDLQRTFQNYGREKFFDEALPLITASIGRRQAKNIIL